MQACSDLGSETGRWRNQPRESFAILSCPTKLLLELIKLLVYRLRRSTPTPFKSRTFYFLYWQEYQQIVDAEWDILYDKLEKLVKSGAQVILSKLPIGDVATQYFADRYCIVYWLLILTSGR